MWTVLLSHFCLMFFCELNEEATKKHQPLTEHPSITRGLSFTFSNLTQSGIRRICKPSGKKNPVVTLQLSHCGLNDECVDCMRELISSRLTELVLEVNAITDVGVIRLSEALQSPTCEVTTVDLGYNGGR